MIEGTFHFAEDRQASAIHYDIRPPNADVVLVSVPLLLELVEAAVKVRGRSWLLIRHDLLGSAGPTQPVVRAQGTTAPDALDAPPKAIGPVIEGTIL